MKAVLALTAILAFTVTSALADDAPAKGDAKAPTASAPAKISASGRTKKLDFEDDVVEGMNRNPLDSLEHVAKRDGRDQSHLYRKRTDFRKEMKETIGEGGFTP